MSQFIWFFSFYYRIVLDYIFFHVNELNSLKMDKYIFFIEVQNLIKTIEMKIDEIESEDCTSVFFTKGNLLKQNQIQNYAYSKCYMKFHCFSFQHFQYWKWWWIGCETFYSKKKFHCSITAEAVFATVQIVQLFSYWSCLSSWCNYRFITRSEYYFIFLCLLLIFWTLVLLLLVCLKDFREVFAEKQLWLHIHISRKSRFFIGRLQKRVVQTNYNVHWNQLHFASNQRWNCIGVFSSNKTFSIAKNRIQQHWGNSKFFISSLVISFDINNCIIMIELLEHFSGYILWCWKKMW